MRLFWTVVLSAGLVSAEKVPTAKLIEMAKAPGLESPSTLEQTLRDTLGEDKIQKGAAAAGELGEFVFAVAAPSQPSLQINENAPLPAVKAGGLWIYQGKLRTGTSYKYTWIVDGKPFGGANNLPAFGPDSYARAGVPAGKLTGPLELESKVYAGMKANVWYYVPAQWDGTTALPVQIWNDGQQFTGARPTQWRVLETLDTLFAQKKIPLMASVFVQPGAGPAANQRSIEYDTMDDTYTRYLLEEILPEIGKHVKLRQDGYSRAMAGLSSGGICAFNAVFLKPGEFSRVLTWIAAYFAIQSTSAHPAGGAEYPILVRKEPKHNIRVWMQDGAEDLENRPGSLPMANIEMANSLKMQGYDYHFSFGVGTHSQAQGAAELPESLVWLWRDYDPAKTSQEYLQDPAEKDLPLWRVVTLNRK
jgi:enterochelin esterase-like enzyme